MAGLQIGAGLCGAGNSWRKGRDSMQRQRSGGLFTNYQLGALVMTSLRDGYVDMPITRLRKPGNKRFGSDFPTQAQLVEGHLRLSVNAFAIDDGSDVVLIDTGASNAWHDTMGRLPSALQEAAIATDRIRTVVFTHTHIDHINGLILPDGSDAFPRLERLLVPAKELDMFRAEERLERFHARAETFAHGQLINPHIEALAAIGHEVGHTCFSVTSQGEKLLVWGDIVHVPSIQFEKPEISWEFDADQDQARQSRDALLALAAEGNCFVAAAHLNSPGVGRVKRAGATFAFEPV